MARQQVARQGESFHTLRREAGAVGLAVVGLIVALAIVTYAPESGQSLVGPAGAAVAEVLGQVLGLASYAIPLGLLSWSVLVFLGRTPEISPPRLAAAAGALVSSAILAHLTLDSWQARDAGGLLGGFLGTVLADSFGVAGAWVIVLAVFLVLLAIATGQSLRDLGAAGAGRGASVAKRGAEMVREQIARRRPFELSEDDVIEIAPAPAVNGRANGRMNGSARVATPPRREAEAKPPVVVQQAPPSAAGRPLRRRQVEMPFSSESAYCLPDLSHLDDPPAKPTVIDHEALIASSRVLETKLGTFEVMGKVREIHPGPVITTYEFEPAPGIKVNRIVTLADDLAMAMSALSVRILAPIPGKSVVGIEVSNKTREKVLIREIVDSDAFRESPSVLTLALGKDTKGNPVVGDLARMPHLLVAGATGTGKSVFLNSLLSSILMRATPRDVRLVLVDPKMLELATYEQIPHLLVPVITEARAAVTVLNNLVKEMNDRYAILKDKGVRNLETYNRAIAEEAGKREVIELADDDDGDEEDVEDEAPAPGPAPIVHQHLPRIVVIIDELADLIMTRRDVEQPITMLAQKARAAGIHMVVATQRPSVDVITGLIKANFPSRISFKVAGAVNSRTILDAIGAERLLGNGDMLFMPPDASKLQRLHGAYISDAEIQNITDFVRKQEPQHYQMDLLQDEEEEVEGSESSGEEEYDTMYDDAVRVVTESGKASISYVQRRLQVGYNRAARMIECMEREGVVSTADHRGAREVLAQKQE
ncbi:MAG: DNA translocase FtsK 4TM domain-containing protein [Candidatus Binatia bacterium]